MNLTFRSRIRVGFQIEDVGKSEQRALLGRMAVLSANLLKWQYLPDRRSVSCLVTIMNQRDSNERCLRKMPSLTMVLDDADWWADAWGNAIEPECANLC